jgi:hypothetical protein
VSETVLPSANRAYGLARVCGVWQVARSTIYHQRNLPAVDPQWQHCFSRPLRSSSTASVSRRTRRDCAVGTSSYNS